MSVAAPDTKAMGAGLAGTIASLVIDVIEGRFDVILQSGEVNAIIVFSAFAAAWMIKDPTAEAAAELNERLKARLDEIRPKRTAPPPEETIQGNPL